VARYGGGTEDFNAEAAALRALREGREELIAAERLSRGETLETAKVEEDVERKRRAARKEKVEVGRRTIAVGDAEVQKTNQDTDAIERNTRARQRQTEAARRANLNVSRALSGASDPQFAAASRIGGADTTQYQMRQQLEGVGSRRARAMQEALQAGFRPSDGSGAPAGPQTRAQAARVGVTQADVEYERAKREYASLLRRKTTTEDERVAGWDARDQATARRRAANIELKSAQETEAASREKAAADRELARRARQEAAQRQVGRQLDIFGGDAAVQRTPQAGGAGGAEPPRPPITGQMAFGDEDDDKRKQRITDIARESNATLSGARATGVYAGELDDMQRAMVQAREARVAQFVAGDAAALDRLGMSARNAGVNFYPLSQAMHRHGALTSEFIAAAARGETTLREIGNQALLTAGKFAGWTAAATAVFGVVGALQRVGEGAIQASSGVDQASRVITGGFDGDALQGAFGDLSQQFNVPVEQAADAVYRMGQVFHDQPAAIKAAEAALYSLKTGEIDVATSTRNLIAIVNGFGLESTQLVGVFDQINQAQNRFGIGIGDTEAGLAKAAGTYRNAGGDVDYLLGLFVAIQKATGRSGTEIGTGIARAVQRIREPISKVKLEQQGIEVDPQDFQKTLQNALQRAATAAPGEVDLQEISTGLFGNQYARLITGVLADQTVLNRALKDTSPEASKGSAQAELAKVLSEVREQLAAVGVGFEVLGSELARAGAFTAFGLLLRGLVEALQLTADLVGLFNELPEGVRQAVMLLGQAAVALQVMRRLGATDALAGGPLGFLAQPDQRLKTHAVAGLRESRQQAFNETERFGREEQRTGMRADIERANAASFARSREFQAAQRLPEEDPNRQRVMARRVELEQRAVRAEADLAAATQNRVLSTKVAQTVDDDLQQAQKLQARQIRTFLVSRNIPVPRELDQPNLRGTTTADDFVPRGSTTAGAERQAGAAAQSARRTSQAARGIRRTMDRAFAEMAVAGGALAAGGGSYSARGAGRATTGLASGLARATSFVGGAASSVRTIPGQVRGFISGLGALDAAIIGFIAFQALDQVADHFSKELDAADDAIQNYRGNTDKAQAELRGKAARVQQGQSEAQYRSDTLSRLNDIFNPVELFGSTLPQIAQGEYETPAQRRARVNLETAQLQAEQENRERIQRERGAQGKARPQLTAGQLVNDIQATHRDRRAGIISMAEFDRRMANYAIEAKTLLDPSKRQRNRVNATLSGALRQGGGASYDDALADLNFDQLDEEAKAITATAAAFGRSGQSISRLSSVYRQQVARLQGKADAKSINQLAEARNAYFDGINTIVQDDLQNDLAQAGGEGGRRDAFRQARGQLNDALNNAQTNSGAAELRLARAEEARRQAQQALGEYSPGTQTDPLTGQTALGGLPAGGERRAQLERDLENAQKQVQDYTVERDAASEELTAARRRLRRLQDELKRQAYSDRQEGRNVRLQLQLSGTADTGDQAATQLRFAAQGVRDAQKTFGRNSREYRQALTELNQARTQVAQAALADVEAENALMIARASGDPTDAANAAVQAARNTLQAMQRQNQQRPGSVDSNAIKQQRAQVITAEIQQAEQQRQEQQQVDSLQAQIQAARAGGDPVAAARAAVAAARKARASAKTRVERLQSLLDLINANNQLEEALRERENARFDLLVSQTDDPVEQARLERNRARNNVKGTKGTERISAQAQYNDAQRNYRNARVESAQDDINFNLEMGKISADVAAQQLEQLAKTKGISKAKQRELILAAKRLRDEAQGDYELDVGNIKLPTLYEVRRFVQGGMPGGGSTVNNNQQITVNVYRSEDVESVANVFGETHGTAGRAAGRSMSLR